MKLLLNAGNSIGDKFKVSNDTRDKILCFMFLLPSICFISFIIVYPMITGLMYSFKNGTMFDSGTFVGLENFKRIFVMPEFWNACRFSAIFSVIGVSGSYGIGLGLALFLNKDVPFRNFFRAAILIPWIVPSIVSIVSWRWLLGDQGSIINTILGAFGKSPILFLADQTWAVLSVSFVKVWRSFPFMMVSLLAVLQTIPEEQYEAARIDGANRLQLFKYVTWPNLIPITIVCGILMTIWSVNDFDTIFLLTNGGPFDSTQNIVVMAYKYSFTKNDIAGGSAMAIITMLTLMILANFVLRVQKKTE